MALLCHYDFARVSFLSFRSKFFDRAKNFDNNPSSSALDPFFPFLKRIKIWKEWRKRRRKPKNIFPPFWVAERRCLGAKKPKTRREKRSLYVHTHTTLGSVTHTHAGKGRERGREEKNIFITGSRFHPLPPSRLGMEPE